MSALADDLARNAPPDWLSPGHPLRDPEAAAFFVAAMRAAPPDLPPALSHMPDVLDAAAAPPVDPELLIALREAAPFSLPAAAFLADAIARVQAADAPRLTSGALRDWRAALLRSVEEMCQQCVTLQYGIARLDAPELDIQDHFDALRDNAHLRAEVLSDYPVLAARLALHIRQQVAIFLRLMQRLDSDAGLVAERLLGLESLPEIEAMSFGEGDLHNGGQSVAILTFQGGARIVYKPRPMKMEAAFFAALEALNPLLTDMRLQGTPTIDRDDYGWVAYVTARPCKTQAEVAQYYRNAGALIALMHLLGGYDFHRENLIAAGPDPVIVDVETLFYATVARPWLGHADPMTSALDYPAVATVVSSVLTTMLLPMGKDRGGDAGLTGGEVRHARKRQYNADKRAIVVGADSHGALTENQPRLNGKRVPPEPHRAAISAGFAAMHAVLVTHRDRLCCATGPLGQLAGIPTRTVLRDTAQYHNLLSESWHPSLLSDPHMVLGHFLHLWGLVLQRPATATAIADEMAQMMRGDVPYFLMNPRSVVMMRADQTATGFWYDKSGAERFAQRVKALGPGTLAIQDWILRAALDPGDLRIRPLYAEAESGLDQGESPRAALAQVHRRLMQLAQPGHGMLDWVTATPAKPSGLAVSPADAGLYSGSAGIVLYLACHAAFTGVEADRDAALRAFATLERQLSVPEDLPSALGVMHGRGGIAYTLLHLARLWHRPELAAQALTLLTPDNTADAQVDFDLTDGAAGLVLVALAGVEMTGQAGFRDLAKLWAQRLVAQCGADGAWVGAAGGRALTGLAHGQSGPILALQRLARVLPGACCANLITRALAVENADFLPERRSWADWRLHNEGTLPDDTPPEVLFHWCNGSAGIALARLELLRAYPSDEALRDQAALGLGSLLDFGMGRDLSLCHGDLGNLDIAQTLQSHLDLPGVSARIGALHGRAHHAIGQGIMPGGLGDGVTTPGLMLGLSGMGLALLRRIDRAAAPDVLTLAAA